MTATVPDWHNAAACKPWPELFYDPEGEKTAAKAVRERQAVAICRSCPALLLCLGDALDRNDGWGVRGGKTEDERRDLRRSRQRAASRQREKRGREQVAS